MLLLRTWKGPATMRRSQQRERSRVGGRSNATSLSPSSALRRRDNERAWAVGRWCRAWPLPTEKVPGHSSETSSVSNLAFYSTFGFEVIGHRRLRGGGPDVWAMFRKPLPDSGRSPAA